MINTDAAILKVLVAPLNWGLGHATRSIPIIRDLLERGVEVVIATDGAALQLLRQEFPQLQSFELPAWNIKYSQSGNFVWSMLLQSGKVLGAVKQEHKAIEALVESENIGIIISDNRLGCYSKKTKSIILTHQLFIEFPVLKGFLNWYNRKALNRFSEVWIVDVPGKNNLSGSLSSGGEIRFKHRHLGIISRFKNAESTGDKLEILAVISGPEPQRTLFEEELLPKLIAFNRKTVVVLGKPGEIKAPVITGNVTVCQDLSSHELAAHFQNAEVIISRSGYTTVMDLVTLNKKAILIPTPGQTEQEYLAKYYQSKNWFTIQYQGSIDLAAIDGKVNDGMVLPDDNGEYLKRAIEGVTVSRNEYFPKTIRK